MQNKKIAVVLGSFHKAEGEAMLAAVEELAPELGHSDVVPIFFCNDLISRRI